METIKKLIDDFQFSVLQDASGSTSRTTRNVQSTRYNLEAAIRQDQLIGQEAAVGKGVAVLIEELLDAHTNAAIYANDTAVSKRDKAKGALLHAIHALRAAPEPAPAPEAFVQLVAHVLEMGKALRSAPEISMVQTFSPEAPHQLSLHQQATAAVEAVLDAYSAAMGPPNPSCVVQGREMLPAPGFDQLLQEYADSVSSYREEVEISCMRPGWNPTALKGAEKRMLAARDAVRGRYLGLDDAPKKEIEPCLVVVLNRVIRAAKEVGVMQNQPASGVPAGKRLEEAVEQFQDTARMLGKVVPCVPRPQTDPLMRQAVIHAAGLCVELDQLMAATEGFRDVLTGTVPGSIVQIQNLRDIRHFQLNMQAVLKQIHLD